MKYFNFTFITLLLSVFISLSSCEDVANNIPEDKSVKQLTLVYAVNNNNLSADLTNNENQMLKAMKDVDSEVYKLLLYKYTSEGPALYEVAEVEGELEFSLIKQYDESVLSATKVRMQEVIADALDLYPDVESTLFFWGHGTGWVNPTKYTNSSSATVQSAASYSYEAGDFIVTVDLPDAQSFGGEYYYDENGSKELEYLDIDLLAEAIPDGKFKTIWFDCCYMSSIEVMYQLRGKSYMIVAYPTEIMAEGLPYNKVLPYIIGSNQDLSKAAETLYEYYTGKSSPDPVTVAVMDMSKIEGVADAARAIFALGNKRPTTSDLQNYSRFSGTPYYDFGQYLRKYADANGGDDTYLQLLKKSLEDFVVYSAASEVDFSYPVGKEILPENFSGLSIHPYNGVKTYREDFYRTLAWYNAVWEE